jgi:hypothetical protein
VRLACAPSTIKQVERSLLLWLYQRFITWNFYEPFRDIVSASESHARFSEKSVSTIYGVERIISVLSLIWLGRLQVKNFRSANSQWPSSVTPLVLKRLWRMILRSPNVAVRRWRLMTMSKRKS